MDVSAVKRAAEHQHARRRLTISERGAPVGIVGPGQENAVVRLVNVQAVERALIVHGSDGLDEISLSAPTQVVEVRGDSGTLVEYTLTPAELGLAEHRRDEVLGGDAEQNAARMRALLAGQQDGALADMVALNAGAALYVTGRAERLVDGLRLAREALRSGQAMPTLDALVRTSRALATMPA